MCAVICRKVTFTASASPFRFPMPIPYLPEHKNPDFVLKTPENEGYECKKRTKMGLLCAFLFRKAAHCGPRCLRLDLGTAQLWSNHLRPALRLASGLVANEPTVCEANRLRTNRLRSRLPAEPTTYRADCLRSRLPAGLEA